ncbi:EVI5-like, partial [Calypte anna]
RLLEADSKSLRSMNGSRRNSGSSLVSSSSASSNLSHLEEDTWILWGRIVNEWDEWRKKKEKLLKVRMRIFRHRFASSRRDPTRSPTAAPGVLVFGFFFVLEPQELIRKGIPHHFRAIVWQLLCSATDMPVKNQYSELLKMSSPCEKLIRRDIARTYPEHEAFPMFPFQEQLPELNVHFRSQSFLTSMYASSWFLTLFLTTFPLPVATRVFDIFMYEGLEIVFRVGMALLQLNQAELVQLDMEGMSQFFQKVIPHQFDTCPDKLILRAFQVKYNPKKMKRLEKEYATIKSKEMEEQIEIK